MILSSHIRNHSYLIVLSLQDSPGFDGEIADRHDAGMCVIREGSLSSVWTGSAYLVALHSEGPALSKVQKARTETGRMKNCLL